ncbi:hypothetical protein FIU45_13300 [Enterococcus faecium]|nr:hypothetical protein GBM82_15860 [Enterococcus faecium]KAB7591431.1 hypothetical protein GBM65_15460 [Enterococcus faecium]PNN29423.1 hypothetical protein AL496_000350 [Enterococcus faecium]RCT68050.1 hypothetical protein B1140_11900 [Enterococcus faecium]TKM56224.1 hypothetical protein DVW61_14570 [Enterococcus faecium]
MKKVVHFEVHFVILYSKTELLNFHCLSFFLRSFVSLLYGPIVLVLSFEGVLLSDNVFLYTMLVNFSKFIFCPLFTKLFWIPN